MDTNHTTMNLDLITYSDQVAIELTKRGISHHTANIMVAAHPDAIVRGHAAGTNTIKATADHIQSHGTTRHDTHDGIPI